MTAPAFTPIDWRAIRDTIWEWFVEMSGCETIWADQSAPQPAYPYASLNILPGTISLGALDEERAQPDGSLLLVGERDFVLSCQIHIGPKGSNDPYCDARMRADCVIASLALPQVRDLLGAVNLGLRERGQPQMLDLVVGTEWIKRAQVDIRFGTMSTVAIADWPNLSDPGWFNRVSISSDISPLRGTGGLNLDDLILDPSA